MSDSLFRGCLSNPIVARQFLSAWLPSEFLSLIDWSTLEARKIAGIDDSLSERREDLVMRVRAADREVQFYLLVEHQSDAHRHMALRVWEYTALVWRQWRTEEGQAITDSHPLPLVIPIVLHPGPGRWGTVRRLRELIGIPDELQTWADSFAPDCGFCLVELAGVPWERLARGHLARAVLAAMQRSRLGALGFDDVRQIVAELFADEHREVAAQLSGIVWTFLLGASELRREQVRCIVEDTIPPEQRIQFMSTADMLREEGLKEGRTEGIREAVAALREAIAVTLTARFGDLPEGLSEAIDSLSDLTRLRAALRAAHACTDLEAFAQSL